MLSKTPRRLFFQGHVSLRLPLRLAPQALLTSPLLAIVIPLRPSAQQPPFPSDSILELTPPARSTVSRGPSGSPSSAAPGAHPDTPLTLGCRCPPNSPPLSLRSLSPPPSKSGSPDPLPSRRPSRRRSPGPSEPPRSAAPREVGAEPEAGSQSGGGVDDGCALALLLPRLRGSRSHSETEPELLREAGPRGREAEPCGRGRGHNRKRRGAGDGSGRTAARKPKSACLRPKAN